MTQVLAGSLSVRADGRCLVRDGRPFMVVADTVWSAFADASLEEWREYSRQRVTQGFTHALVSVLPVIHDRAIRDGAREPFALTADGTYRYDEPDASYFENARRMAEIATESGLELMLVVLWCNYIEDTWGAARTPGSPMGADDRRAYVDMVVETFADLRPVFIISGDDRFDGEPARRDYLEALHQVKAAAPDCLTTMHSTPDTKLPETIADDPALDFYSYQAGHFEDRLHLAWELAAQYLAHAVRRPIMDLEPCYEGHGFGNVSGSGRFRREDVRRATWWSLAGGASAGIGYGAHGLWQWYREGARFTSTAWSLEPFTWRTALGFPGADDVAFAAALLTTEGLVGAEPRQDVLVEPFDGLRAFGDAESSRLALYLPDARDVTLSIDVSAREVVAWDLDRRVPVSVSVTSTAPGSVIRRPDVLADLVIVFRDGPR